MAVRNNVNKSLGGMKVTQSNNAKATNSIKPANVQSNTVIKTGTSTRNK
ncbi:hypothetical protein JF544_05610 [Halobacillus kuroshimensis]|uniref:Uncharacterized protein n=1 Tax=Halobacillus kuroshimensis TaxID=302481 RepID=A0ABS3DTX8_9BACI|nr:hypothetical protein [Halobacillus kuroshimensis]MBN8234714.1 hypothetical protein [Halobacillus kuroshimensis]